MIEKILLISHISDAGLSFLSRWSFHLNVVKYDLYFVRPDKFSFSHIRFNTSFHKFFNCHTAKKKELLGSILMHSPSSHGDEIIGSRHEECTCHLACQTQ